MRTQSDPLLRPGQCWLDPYTSLSLSAVSATPAGLSLNVESDVNCQRALPTIEIKPNGPTTIHVGGSVQYTVTVTNNDRVFCAPRNLVTSIAPLPNALLASMAVGTPVAPKTRATFNAFVNWPLEGVAGTFPVTVTAASPEGSVTASSSLTVDNGYSLSVSVRGQGFPAGRARFPKRNTSDHDGDSHLSWCAGGWPADPDRSWRSQSSVADRQNEYSRAGNLDEEPKHLGNMDRHRRQR